VATCCFKRRIANRQAVNRKAEAIEPRNAYFEKDDILGTMEVTIGVSVNGKEITASPGSASMACLIV